MSMTYTQQAIEKAIEGGWDKSTAEMDFDPSGGAVALIEDIAFLDPDFWRALSESEKWEKTIDWTPLDSVNCSRCAGEGNEVSMGTQRTWKYHWHRLIDHLADGGDIETYFKQIIKSKLNE